MNGRKFQDFEQNFILQNTEFKIFTNKKACYHSES